MPRGGARAGAGRKPGSSWKPTLRAASRAQIAQLMNSPRDPLSRICAIAVDDGLPLDVQMEAIRICLPYLHPRLSAMASVTVKTENRDPSAILAKLQNAMRAAVTDTAPDAQLIEAQAEPVAA